jgi:hypothetical protein
LRTLRIIISPAASLSVAHNSRRPGGVITQVGTIAETPTTAGAALPAFPVARAEPQGRAVRPEFNGSAAEYFRIWIVNLFFTLITLGVYSAWPKVRKKKYFYGSTRLGGEAFDYLARDFAALLTRMEKADAPKGGGIPPFLSSHPTTAEREALAREAAETKPNRE